MTGGNALRWLEWAREIQALSQTGYHYAENQFQRQRNRRLTEIAAEIISEHSDLEYDPLVGVFASQSGYATPRMDVRGAVFRNREILLVKERDDGGWTMPGGWMDVGDKPSRAVAREVFEESGYRVAARKVIGVYDANRLQPLELFHAVKVVFLCELIEGEARPSEETSDVAFFTQGAIPSPLSGERTKSRHIVDAFSALEHPDCPTVFD